MKVPSGRVPAEGLAQVLRSISRIKAGQVLRIWLILNLTDFVLDCGTLRCPRSQRAGDFLEATILGDLQK